MTDTHLPLDLLSRAYLEKAISLFGRMLNELDQVHFGHVSRMTSAGMPDTTGITSAGYFSNGSNTNCS
jgi:hypothetical protein